MLLEIKIDNNKWECTENSVLMQEVKAPSPAHLHFSEEAKHKHRKIHDELILTPNYILELFRSVRSSINMYIRINN